MNREKQASKLSLVLNDEQLEGMFVSALRPFDQRLVNFTVAHLIAECSDC